MKPQATEDMAKENVSTGGDSRKRESSLPVKREVKKSKNGRTENLMAAFEFEVSQALKAVYLDSRYRHLSQYTFVYNYTSYVSMMKLS